MGVKMELNEIQKQWRKRLEWLASQDKTPKRISEDIIIALHEIDVLNERLNYMASLTLNKTDNIWTRRVEDDLRGGLENVVMIDDDSFKEMK
jgi:hypothetical protein